MIRNAILLAGSQRLENAVNPLTAKLREDEIILRAAAAWALGQIANKNASRLLEEANLTETDPYVRDAIAQALCKIDLDRTTCDRSSGLRD
jgi:HEAT repeat protein